MRGLLLKRAGVWEAEPASPGDQPVEEEEEIFDVVGGYLVPDIPLYGEHIPASESRARAYWHYLAESHPGSLRAPRVAGTGPQENFCDAQIGNIRIRTAEVEDHVTPEEKATEEYQYFVMPEGYNPPLTEDPDAIHPYK